MEEMTHDDKIEKDILKLFKEVNNKDIKFNKNNLLQYLSIQDLLPFNIYFQNEFGRIMKKDSLKNKLFLNIDSGEKVDILNYIKENIKKEFEEKNKKIESEEKTLAYKKYVKNNKTKEKNTKKIIQSCDNKTNINILNDNINNNNKLFNTNSNYNSSNNSTNDKNKSLHDSTLSIMMDLIKEKFDKNMNDIDNLILKQKQNILKKIIDEYKFSESGRLTYFNDTNNLSGDQFEYAGIKYIFELLNCISSTRDFNFYTNIKISFK